MELRLDDKVALVTGASRGIGRAVATRLAEAGARVMISARKPEMLEKAASAIAASVPGAEVDFTVANAGDPEAAEAAVTATVARFGALQVLVNNAGTNPYFGPTVDIDRARADKTVSVNLQGPLVWTQCAWRMAMAQSGGSVVNIASIGGLSVDPGIGYYNVTKAALIHLTRQLAFELGPSVRVNAVAPGLIRTDFAQTLIERGGDAVAARLPLKRLGEPDDVAKVVLFLVSEAAAWMTGATVVVDGGALALPTGGA
jgi:NAD(P)-dependent dehydrogenase (short-subunit alcohol dehydrogenase family)